MAVATKAQTVGSHFTGKAPSVHETYAAILAAARRMGPVWEEPKKTSIHLVRRTAFAGVATRKEHLILTLKSDHALKSPRIYRSEKASAARFHHEIKLASPADVDAELAAWLRDAYRLSL
jgi:hypothetical protein